MTPEKGASLSEKVPQDERDEATFRLFEAFFREAAQKTHEITAEHGFHDEPRTVGDLLALAHSELSEALEEFRKNDDPRHKYYRESDNKPEGFGVELADVIIRLMDMSVLLGIDLAAEVTEKIKFNKTRSHRHGGKFL